MVEPGAKQSTPQVQTATQPVRAVLVSVTLTQNKARGADWVDTDEAEQEAKQLAESGGFQVVAQLHARRLRADPRYYVGSGKVEELRIEAMQQRADVVIFDVALSPAQQRNIQLALKVPVLDRTALILELFAQRARSKEGRLQVELAQLRHLSTRLVRGWTHLERQRGGLSKTGGPGEKQIELDRRQIAQRIRQLRVRLDQLGKQRQTQRRSRARRQAFTVSLVGYTNAGKSTLFNALTKAGTLAADQLFATLDTTARRCFVEPGKEIILSDTVGFIRGLPHELIEAFKSTLEESVQADLLLHVVDGASSMRDAQIETVDQVLEDIGAGDVPRIVVYNKIDAIGAEDEPQLSRQPALGRDAHGRIDTVYLSAASGEGLDLLRQAIAQAMDQAVQSNAHDMHEGMSAQTQDSSSTDASSGAVQHPNV